MSLRKNSAGNTQTYFNYTLKSGWQHLVFYIILMLLAVVLPTVVFVSEFSEMAFDRYEYRVSLADEYLIISAVLTFIVSCAIAVFASMSALSYVNSKQAVGLFHSFPVTRRTVFFTETGVKAIYFAAALFVGVLISRILLEMNMPHSPEARIFYVQMIIMSILGFALFYSIGISAAGVSGTGLLRFLIMCLIIFLPIAVYALVCVAVGQGMDTLDINRYLDFRFVKWLCPVTFVADIILGLAGEGTGERLGFGVYVVLMLIPTALFYFGGLLLHMKRKSETSGTSIIWKPVFLVIKYAVMFVCSLCGILLFGAMSGGDGGWVFIGGLCGLLLSFMLANVILYRSVRSMFRGVKGLGIMAAVMVLFSAFTVYDAAGLNERVLSAENTRSLEVTLRGVTVEYTDEEDIEALVPMLRDYLAGMDTAEYWDDTSVIDNLYAVDENTAADMDKYLVGYRREAEVYYDDMEKYYAETAVSYYENGVPVITEVYPTEEKSYRIRTRNDSYDLDWGQIPKVGIPSYRSTWIHYTAAARPLIEYIIASDEYAAEVNGVKKCHPDSVGEVNLDLFGYDEYFYNQNNHSPQ
ncbi:MAG: hypothetical protein E7638_06260, partial [Ruminococcaceae bacterium]|nr:hypothetical protein [Oscillospiraceae bacterium]